MESTALPSSSMSDAPVVAIIGLLRQRYGDPPRLPENAPIDELVQTILSQHTSDVNTERAFASLREHFPTWEGIIEAPTNDIANAIRSGGLADLKAPRIQQVLREVRERTGGFDLTFLGLLPTGEAREWLESLHGVGPKTAACVLLFSLNRDVMPVDTHVHRVALRLGLIPARTSASKAHDLLEAQIPRGMTYDAHMLFIRHGRETCVARRPRCGECVLVQCCPTGQQQLAERLGIHDDQTH